MPRNHLMLFAGGVLLLTLLGVLALGGGHQDRANGGEMALHNTD